MKIKTLAIHPSTSIRMNALLRTMQRYGHTITNTNDKNSDLFFVDCIWPDRIPKKVVDSLRDFDGHIVLMSLGDMNMFRLNILPDDIVDKVKGFAKIQWSKDTSIYDPRILNKKITVHPFLIDGIPQPINKKSKACFFGLPTGEENSDQNLRIKCCRILKEKEWFVGGIVGQEPGAKDRDISGLEIGHRPRHMYLNAINQAILSICMPGNSPLTYRLFESLGVGSAVVSCSLDSVEWLNKMESGKHYIQVDESLDNLLDTCLSCLNERSRTFQIAQNGHSLYNQYYKIESDGGLTDNMWRDISSQFVKLGIPV